MDLQGRSALVAGAGGGIGEATARRLAGKGVGVVVFDEDAELCAKVANDIGDNAIGIAGDLNDDDAVGAAIAAGRSLGTFSILVNAASWHPHLAPTVAPDGTVHDIAPFIETQRFFSTGTFNPARLAAATFATNEPDADGERGVIVNSASIIAFDGQAQQVAYAASKAAVVGMTLPMARDLAAIGVRVCAIAAGRIDTPILTSEEFKQRLVKDVVFPKRLGRPDEFAQLVEAIVCISFLNGEVIRLDGGARLPPSM